MRLTTRHTMDTLATLALAALMLVTLTGCDAVGDPAAPDLEPQFAAAQGHGNGQGRSREVTEAGEGTAPKWQRVASSGPLSGAATGVFQGGLALRIQDANGRITSLDVRPGTVRRGTRFSMTYTNDGAVGVSLSATSPGGAENDAGSAGFRRPVTLCVDRRLLSEPGERAEFGIAESWQGELLPVPTYATATQVCGRLRHFSLYYVVRRAIGYTPVVD